MNVCWATITDQINIEAKKKQTDLIEYDEEPLVKKIHIQIGDIICSLLNLELLKYCNNIYKAANEIKNNIELIVRGPITVGEDGKPIELTYNRDGNIPHIQSMLNDAVSIIKKNKAIELIDSVVDIYDTLYKIMVDHMSAWEKFHDLSQKKRVEEYKSIAEYIVDYEPEGTGLLFIYEDKLLSNIMTNVLSVKKVLCYVGLHAGDMFKIDSFIPHKVFTNTRSDFSDSGCSSDDITSKSVDIKLRLQLVNENSSFNWESLFTIESLKDLVVLDMKACSDKGYSINRCSNCGKYFIPANRVDTMYCPNIFGKTGKKCSEIGARLQYNKKIDDDPLLSERKAFYKSLYAPLHRPRKDMDQEQAKIAFNKLMAEADIQIDQIKDAPEEKRQQMTEELLTWMDQKRSELMPRKKAK